MTSRQPTYLGSAIAQACGLNPDDIVSLTYRRGPSGPADELLEVTFVPRLVDSSDPDSILGRYQLTEIEGSAHGK